MPRKDQTFTPGDVIRIWCNHLDGEEQNWVFLFFFTVVPGIWLTNDELTAIFEIIEKETSNYLLKFIIKTAIKYMSSIRTILNESWVNMVFSSPIKEEVIACITKRLARKSKSILPGGL